MTTEQNVTFVDNEGGVQVVDLSTTNAAALVDGTEDISLGQFLSRPTLINTTTWLSSDITGVKTTIAPWSLFLTDPLIRKKIDNYAFLRAKLHVKVVLNGTPFQYGQMRVHYSPMEGIIPDKVRADQGGSPIPTLIPYSQQPGFYVYPQANAGGEMVLPFFYHRNWLDITTAARVSEFGTLRYSIYYPLQTAATGGTTTVTVRTYAWMSDVHLMGSTFKLALQADEYGVGPVSRPASALSALAHSLTHVPHIGRFARATEIGASAVSQVASLFGYTNVPVIDDVKALQPMNAPFLASAQIGAPLQKLALDPKQELSIDPSPHGLGSQDELAIASLKVRESYYAATSWSTSDLPGTLLYNGVVSPTLNGVSDIVNGSSVKVGARVWHTPLSWMSTMFSQWRGDIIIRVKIVCTKFHKGRLKISYDPVLDIATSDPPENSVYTQILDIGENDDVELRIPYHQALAWLGARPMLTSGWSPGLPAVVPNQATDNGALTVRVLTSLTAPVSGSIGLLFFIRGADNFEFANPVETVTGLQGQDGLTGYPVPSLFALQADDKVDITTTTISLGPPATVFPERFGLNYGQAISSLRTLLHRAMISDNVPVFASSTNNAEQFIKVYKRMPYSPGYHNGANVFAQNVVGAGTSRYMFNNMHIMPYVASPFLGYRGSTNYYITAQADSYGFVDDIRVSRLTKRLGTAPFAQGTIDGVLPFASTIGATMRFFGAANRAPPGWSGMAVTSNRTNASLTFNVPDLNNFNFSVVNPAAYPTGVSTDGTLNQGAMLSVVFRNKATGADNGQQTVNVITEASAGPDFTCLFFLCVPTMDYATAIPAAV